MIKSSTFTFAKDTETNKPIQTSVKQIIQNRMLWEGDSGSGKSHGMVSIIEGTDELCQRIVVDLEGEYFTLKNNFSFLLVGKSTDKVTVDVELNTNDIHVEKLAQKILLKSVDTVIDLSEFSELATHFLSVFLLAIMKNAKLMKRPLLVFVDEAHEFAPEKGTGKEESLKAMIRIAKRGRKHGIGLICGTQAIADFSKNVVRQLRTRFIGNCTYDNDVKDAAGNLGFGKDRQNELRNLADNHEFFTSSQGITIGGKRPTKVLKIKAVENKTELYDFDFDKKIKIQPKNPKAIKEIASEFADIPKLVDSELSENQSLKNEVNELKVKLRTQVKEVVPVNNHKVLEENYQAGFRNGLNEGYKRSQQIEANYKNEMDKIRIEYSKFYNIISNLKPYIISTIDNILKNPIAFNFVDTTKFWRDIDFVNKLKENTPPKLVQSTKETTSMLTTPFDSTQPKQGVIKMLQYCAMFYPKSIQKTQLSTLAGYTAGTLDNYLGQLIKLQWVQVSNDEITITTEGMKNAGDYQNLPTDPKEILNLWLPKFKQGAAKVLQSIFDDGELSKQTLLELTHFTVGTLDNYLGQLRSNGLIEIDGNQVSLSKTFPTKEIIN